MERTVMPKVYKLSNQNDTEKKIKWLNCLIFVI